MINGIEYRMLWDRCNANRLTEISTTTEIIYSALGQGVFVYERQIAIMRLLIKKRGMQLITLSYRLWTNFNLSKILEVTALTQFQDHCDNCQLFLDHQYAYRKDHSCETLLVKWANDLLWSVEMEEVFLVIAVDLSVEFDTLNSAYNEVTFNKKLAITKENLPTKYTPFTYKDLTLNEKLPITKQNLCIFFFVIGGVECTVNNSILVLKDKFSVGDDVLNRFSSYVSLRFCQVNTKEKYRNGS